MMARHGIHADDERAVVHADDGRSVSEVPSSVPGRVTVDERVYRVVAEQAAAALIGVPRRDVGVETTEYGAGISYRIQTPLPVPRLDDDDAIRRTVPVIEQARAIQENLQTELGTILGRDVTRIALTITGAVVRERNRVR